MIANKWIPVPVINRGQLNPAGISNMDENEGALLCLEFGLLAIAFCGLKKMFLSNLFNKKYSSKFAPLFVREK